LKEKDSAFAGKSKEELKLFFWVLVNRFSELPAPVLLLPPFKGVVLRNFFRVKPGVKMPETERVDSSADERDFCLSEFQGSVDSRSAD